MSTIARPQTRVLPVTELFRLRVDQYERLVADGTIAEDDPVELLDGILVRTMPKGPGHEAKIPAYWIVNLVEDRLEVYIGPTEGEYPPPAILAAHESVDLVLDGQVIARIPVADLLPDRP